MKSKFILLKSVIRIKAIGGYTMIGPYRLCIEQTIELQYERASLPRQHQCRRRASVSQNEYVPKFRPSRFPRIRP